MREKFGTHNGPFHADDVMAAAILVGAKRFDDEDAIIVRTRDPKVLETCDVVFDVGGIYDVETRRFDHHQTGRAGARPNGVLYSSAGLVWKHAGMRYIELRTERVDAFAVWERVDARLMQAIDAADNGQEMFSGGAPNFEGARGVSFSAIVSGMNPTWMERQDHDSRFFGAMEFAGGVLRRAVAEALGHIEARGAVLGALKHQGGNPAVLILERFVPWSEHLLETGADTLYVVFPDTTGAWMCQAVPKEPHSFEKRKALPESWAGKRDADFAALTGVEDGVFAHPGLFICGARSREGALRLASLATAA